MIVKLLTEHYYEFLSLKGECRGSSESTHVKMPHCWKSHALAHFISAALKPSLTWSPRLGALRAALIPIASLSTVPTSLGT